MHEATLGIGFAGGSLFGGIAGTYGGDRMPYVLGIVVIAALFVLQIALYARRRPSSSGE
jgi:hypothetical protein